MQKKTISFVKSYSTILISIDFNGFNYPNLVGNATDAFNDTDAAYNMTFSDQVQYTNYQTLLSLVA